MDIELHLATRAMTPRIAKIWMDSDRATFPLVDMLGDIRGFQEYVPTGKKKIHVRGEAKYWTYAQAGYSPFWAPLEFFEWVKETGYCFVQEGIFSAAPLVAMGFPAVAILSDSNSQLIRNLHIAGVKTVTLADGDPAGQKILRKVHRGIALPDAFDVGDIWEQKGLYEVKKLATDCVHLLRA